MRRRRRGTLGPVVAVISAPARQSPIPSTDWVRTATSISENTLIGTPFGQRVSPAQPDENPSGG
jgi:hypothetical protein